MSSVPYFISWQGATLKQRCTMHYEYYGLVTVHQYLVSLLTESTLSDIIITDLNITDISLHGHNYSRSSSKIFYNEEQRISTRFTFGE